MGAVKCAVDVPRVVRQGWALQRLQPFVAFVVHHRPAVHIQKQLAHTGTHQERPQPAVQSLRARSIHQRTVSQPRPKHIQRRHGYTVDTQHGILPQRARPLQLLNGRQRRRYHAEPGGKVGRNDAKTGHQRLRDCQHRVYRVLAARPVHILTTER